MNQCCIESLALKGLADGFAVTPEGGGWTCDQCGEYYQIVSGRWTPAYKCPHCHRVSFYPADRRARYCGACHAFEGMRVMAGQYYWRDHPDGPLRSAPPGEPTEIICRRVTDFPNHTPPPGAAVRSCRRCTAAIAFNPARQYTAPMICMQCAGIQPDPL